MPIRISVKQYLLTLTGKRSILQIVSALLIYIRERMIAALHRAPVLLIIFVCFTALYVLSL